MTVFIAALVALLALAGANLVMWFVLSLARGSSPAINALVDYSAIGWVIKGIGWFGCAWLAMSVFQAMGGL
ncbi:hypothetical protein [Devosia sp. 2618]|uniref:hypothetical protein n=1 Tax=Devosia sp. 2618 TaxID=3156454 RepID=UPI0033958B7A